MLCLHFKYLSQNLNGRNICVVSINIIIRLSLWLLANSLPHCLFVHPPSLLSDCLIVYLSLCPFVCISDRPCVSCTLRPSVCFFLFNSQSFCLSMFLSFHQSVSMSTCLFICSFTRLHQYIFLVSIHLPVNNKQVLPVCLHR